MLTPRSSHSVPAENTKVGIIVSSAWGQLQIGKKMESLWMCLIILAMSQVYGKRGLAIDNVLQALTSTLDGKRGLAIDNVLQALTSKHGINCATARDALFAMYAKNAMTATAAGVAQIATNAKKATNARFARQARNAHFAQLATYAVFAEYSANYGGIKGAMKKSMEGKLKPDYGDQSSVYEFKTVTMAPGDWRSLCKQNCTSEDKSVVAANAITAFICDKAIYAARAATAGTALKKASKATAAMKARSAGMAVFAGKAHNAKHAYAAKFAYFAKGAKFAIARKAAPKGCKEVAADFQWDMGKEAKEEKEFEGDFLDETPKKYGKEAAVNPSSADSAKETVADKAEPDTADSILKELDEVITQGALLKGTMK